VAYDVVIWCPDRHIVYDGRTPDERGVGGGITARVRMARALARRGHRVTVVANCGERERIDGVDYVPLEAGEGLRARVLILTTSGGELDLSGAGPDRVPGDLRIVWVHGVDAPQGLANLRFDCVYCVSSYIAGMAQHSWGVPAARLFVSYNAYDESAFAHRMPDSRNPFRLVYFSHPSKGLETAIEVTRRLRLEDPRFHLVVFGTEQLWGGEEKACPDVEGVFRRGLVGQKDLAAELLQATYCVQLQHREEPGALAIVEALRAGCILLASPVGCYPEMIVNGENGFLIDGDHRREQTRQAAAETILALSRDSELRKAVERTAQTAPWSSDRIAEAWEGHWDWWFGGRRPDRASEPCAVCGSTTLTLADGLHCLECSTYRTVSGSREPRVIPHPVA
jgi:glycosyltransferase involved in cell wall biosynthesis